LASFVYVVPLYKGACLIEGAYRFNPESISEISLQQSESWHYFVPLELPDPIRALLPDLPQFTSFELQLVGNVSVLLGYLHGLAVKTQYAAKLMSSSNRFDMKQYHALTAQIQVAFDDVKSEANTVTGQIASEFQDHRQDPLLQPSLEMLDALTATKNPEDLVSVYLSEAFDQSLILGTFADRVSQTMP